MKEKGKIRGRTDAIRIIIDDTHYFYVLKNYEE
jgi:hypothetical protein